MSKMAFGLDGSYRHSKSNCSNMLAWNELRIVEGQSGPSIYLKKGDAVISVLHCCQHVA